MNRRLFAQKAGGFLAGVGALLGVKTAGAERLSTPRAWGSEPWLDAKLSQGGMTINESREEYGFDRVPGPKPATRVKITKISSRSTLGRIEFEVQYEITHLTKSGTKVVRRKDTYRGNRAIDLDLS